MKSKSFALVLLTLGGAWQPSWSADLRVQVRNLDGLPLEDAVIYAEPLHKSAHSVGPLPRITIDQVNRQFVPLVTVLRVGTEVSFPNSDNIRHSIYSFSPAKTFTTKLYSGRQAPPVIFDTPGLVVLGCNIHDAMAAWVLVVDTGYFSKSGADGAGTLKDLEVGDYQLSVWYPGPRFEPVVLALHVGSEALSREVKVDDSASPLPALRARAKSQAATTP